MKSLKNKIYKSELIIKLRNTFGIKKINLNISNLQKHISISDAFCWRTDNDYTTTFKFTDILKLFYKINDSDIELKFYSKNNKFIKKIEFKKIDLFNELLIDKKFMGGIEDYGSFYIFHKNIMNNHKDMIISNRCYLGFSYKNNLKSYVHGNMLARYLDVQNNKVKNDIIKTSFVKNQTYKIQNYFSDYDNIELFFANPTSYKIIFDINKKNYSLNPGNSIIINFKTDKIIKITSNSLFMRPTIFNYKNNFIDVLHG